MKKKDDLEYYDNRWRVVQQEEVELSERLIKKRKEREMVENQRRDSGIKKYADESIREEIIKKGEENGYSEKGLNKIKEQHDNWTQDSVTNEIISELINIEMYCKKTLQHESDYRENIFYKMSRLVRGDGGDEYDD
jgi:hypothetical protein